MSALTLILFLCALILGALGYIERIYDLRLSRRLLVGLLILFILISAGQFTISIIQDLELKERLNPRQWTEEQTKNIITALKNNSPGDVWLFCKSGDEEACNLGKQLFTILKSANWNIVNNTLHDLTVSTPNIRSLAGIVITINKDLNPIPHGIELLHKNLLQIGFASRIDRSSKDSIEIWIGAKLQMMSERGHR